MTAPASTHTQGPPAHNHTRPHTRTRLYTRAATNMREHLPRDND